MKRIAPYVIAGIAGGLVTLGGARLLLPSAAESHMFGQANHPAIQARQASYGQDGALPVNFTTGAERSMPSVVHILSTEDTRPRTERERQFYYFFGEPQPQQSTGSGVILNKDGYIVTNNHVVEDAGEIEVTLFDNRKFKAKLIGTDPSTDLAVVKIDAPNLQLIEFANSDDVRVGQWCLAVGNPFNLTSTVTAGIISAKGRNIDIIKGQRPIESFIQTDAVVNPGNSGGALVDTEGNLIGINTAIATQTGYYSGYSFAVPSNLVKKVVYDLIKYGSVHRAMMGVSITDLDATLAQQEKLDISEGVYIMETTPDGGAAEAGLKAGDVIVAVENVPVKSVPELQEKIASRNPGDAVRVTINRKGLRKDLSVKLKK